MYAYLVSEKSSNSINPQQEIINITTKKDLIMFSILSK